VSQVRDQRRALLWLVSAFGVVAVARYDAHVHPALAPALESVSPRTLPASPEAAALRDGRPMAINRARAEELELLPGVGPSLAKRIVEARERGGPFYALADLGRVKGLGKRTQEKLAQFLSFEVEARGSAREQDPTAPQNRSNM
jgi:competence ComEA-like helix-hairpin-helix protein